MKSKVYGLWVWLLLLNLFSVGGSEARVIIVSDLDDTIKVSNVGNKLDLMKNVFLGAPSFPLLISLYQRMAHNLRARGESVEFYYLTATPDILPITSWLESYGAPTGRVVQKPILGLFESTYDYKRKEILRLLDHWRSPSSKTVFYFFGDNGEQDPRAYLSVVEELKLQRAHIIIRTVKAKAEELPGIIYFTSELELLNLPPFRSLLTKADQNFFADFANEPNLLPSYIIESFELESYLN